MPITPLLVGTLETLFNQYLQLDVDRIKSLMPLQGKRLRIDIAELPFPLLLVFSTSRIDFLSGKQDDWDCRIRIALIDLPKLQKGESLSRLIKHDRLTLEGETELAQQFASMLHGLEIDWQEPLSRWVGDPLTHLLTVLVENGRHFAQRQATEGREQLARFITDEAFLVAHPLALAAFADDVQLVVADVDDIEARVTRLERLQAKSE